MAIKIHKPTGGVQGEALTFTGARITLGRKDDNDVVFGADCERTVSAHHGEIIFRDDAWFYRDRGSSNGSFCDGKKVETLKLIGGEEIEMGRRGPVIVIELEPRNESSGEVEKDTPIENNLGEKKKFGSKTVGRMIESALADSKGSRLMRTSFIRAVAKDAVRRGSRRFKIVVGMLIVLLFATILFLLLELDRARDDIQDISVSKMGPSEIGEWIVTNNHGSIYLLIYRTQLGYEKGFCTGFAAKDSGLLTNAHCVAQMKTLALEGSTFFAAPNEGEGVRYPIVKWKIHPAYDVKSTTPTPDIGLVTVKGKLPELVSLAEPKHLAGLRPGSQIFVFGFPGDLSDVRSPVATITEGVVGRLTALDGMASAPSVRHLLQHSAFTSKGTSGSPVFDKSGRVIAINSGYYQGRSRVKLENPLTGKSEEAEVYKDLSGYSFGIRIDLARKMLR